MKDYKIFKEISLKLAKTEEDWLKEQLKNSGLKYLLKESLFLSLFMKNEKIQIVEWPSRSMKWLEIGGKKVGVPFVYGIPKSLDFPMQLNWEFENEPSLMKVKDFYNCYVGKTVYHL